MSLKPELLTNLFERAMAEELGLVVTTNNPKQLQFHLNNHRREYNLTIFADIIVCVPSEPNTVILVKKSVDLNDVQLT